MLDINFDQVNKLYIDKFGRKSGIFAIDKPKGKTSHDIVYEVRRKLGTKKVGHAGALDPFADGLLIILVGVFTKKTEQFINLDKTYVARVLFGIHTDSGDIEGNILHMSEQKYSKEQIEESADSFNGGYDQYVPIFSSVKVAGMKLRELAREAESFSIEDSPDGKLARFKMNSEMKNRKIQDRMENSEILISIPKKPVKVDLKIKEIGQIKSSELSFIDKTDITEFQYADIEIKCSKGTYIRQIAIDLAEKLGGHGMLIGLRRTSIDSLTQSQMLSLDEFNQMPF